MSNFFPTSQPPVDEVTWSRGRSMHSRSKRSGKRLNPSTKFLNVLSCNQLFMQSSCRACYIQTCTSDTKYLQAMPPYFPQIVHFVCGAAEILYALSESRTIGSYPNFASSKGRWEKPAKGNTFHQRSNVEKESLGSSRVSPK